MDNFRRSKLKEKALATVQQRHRLELRVGSKMSCKLMSLRLLTPIGPVYDSDMEEGGRS